MFSRPADIIFALSAIGFTMLVKKKLLTGTLDWNFQLIVCAAVSPADAAMMSPAAAPRRRFILKTP